MTRRNAPKIIPLNNDNREIVKAGIYRCCRNEWMRPNYFGYPLYDHNRVEVCNKCKKIVDPIRNEEWTKRWYGHFKCTYRLFLEVYM